MTQGESNGKIVGKKNYLPIYLYVGLYEGTLLIQMALLKAIPSSNDRIGG